MDSDTPVYGARFELRSTLAQSRFELRSHRPVLLRLEVTPDVPVDCAGGNLRVSRFRQPQLYGAIHTGDRDRLDALQADKTRFNNPINGGEFSIRRQSFDR